MGFADLSRYDDDKQRRLICQLRARGTRDDRRVANVLARCTEANPCRSGACIHCGRDFQRVALDVVEREIRGPARRDLRGRMSFSTVVPTAGCLAPDDLSAAACQRIMADITTALDDCKISPRVLGFDISFNEDETGKVEPHWCTHGHVPALDWVTAEQEAILRTRFPKSRLVRKPVLVELLDGNDNGPLYSFKPDRGRRVSYLTKSNSYRRSHRNTRRRDLRDWQAVKLAHVEHELGFDTRLMVSGIDENAFNAALNAFYRARDGP